MDQFQVISTEKVPFTYRVAGVGSRFLAWLADAGAMILLGFAGMMAGGVLEQGRAGLGLAVIQLWIFGVTWGYFLFFEWLWYGQTPGKRLLGIRVIQTNGTSVTFFQSAARNLVRVVDALPFLYALGFAAAASNRHQRRLGDWAAGTLVVHVERRARPIQAISESPAAPASEGLGRQRLGQLTKPQKQTLLDLCLRRDQLRIADRARLFRAVAEYFQQHLDLAPAEHQSDEKFVLQLVSWMGQS
jgi:uncharacterized RDD family membrane protein YckC